MLHNSWTPNVYAKMDSKTFLGQNITLAKLLRELKSKDR